MWFQRFGRLLCLAYCCVAIGSATSLAQAKKTNQSDPPITKRWQQTVGDWVVNCAQGADGRKACSMSQTLSNSKTRQMIAALAISRDASGKTNATVTVPMGVLVSIGLRAGVDEKSAVDVPFRTCIAQGCVAIFEMSNQYISQIGKAEKFTVATRTVEEKPLTVEFSLKGFAKAHEVLVQETK